MAEKRVIPRDKLGVLTKIGQGGQGVVYRAPNVKTKFAESMVYKEYKPAALAEIDFTALAAMPALVEESLSYGQAERLVSVAAWPCAIVEDADTPTGFVMPAIPEQFFISLSTVKGVSSTTAEFQHLLNAASVLAARDIGIDEAQRYALLREVASGLAFVHKHGVCIGDISPKNLLFSLSPHEAVYFIDCDAVRVNGVSALPQVETPGWAVPAGEELATIYSDTYKLGLLALRLLAGDQDVKNPQYIPAGAPSMVRQIITDTLTNEPEKRPLPEAWTYVLGHAIEDAQHRRLTATATTTTAAAELPAPEIPTVKSRPARTTPPPKPTPYAPPVPWTSPVQSGPRISTANRWFGIALAVPIIAAVVLLSVLLARTNNRAPSSAPDTSATQASTPAPTSTSEVPPPTTTSSPPPDMFAVIVGSAKAGQWATAKNYTSLDEAENQAMTLCRKKTGDCKRLTWNRNGCVALAATPQQWSGGHGSTLQEAEQDAISFNGGGRILVSLCTS